MSETTIVDFADLADDSELAAQLIDTALAETPDLAKTLKSKHEITVHVKCPGDVHQLLKDESERTGLSLPHILKEYAIDFIRIRNEALLTATDAVMNGQGSIIHNMLLGFEQRLIKTVEHIETDMLKVNEKVSSISDLLEKVDRLVAAQEQQAESMKRLVHQVNRANTAVEGFVFSYYLHTPQVPEELQDGHLAAATLRYNKFMDRLEKAMGVEKNGAY